MSNKIYNIQDWANVGTVSIPGASSSKIYPKVDGWYIMDSVGIEQKLAVTGDVTDIKYHIQSTETVVVATYSQYLVYGNLKVDGILTNYGQVVILNGSLDLTGGGTFSNAGTLLLQTLQTGIEKNKFSTGVTFSGGIAKTITHNLNTTGIVVQLWDVSTGESVIGTLNNRTSTTVDVTLSATFSSPGIDIVLVG